MCSPLGVMGDTGDGAELAQSIADFATYEDFLDSQVSDLDLYYLEVSASQPPSPSPAPCTDSHSHLWKRIRASLYVRTWALPLLPFTSASSL